MNPHLSQHDSLNMSMIDATPPCPIMIYYAKNAGLHVADLFCLLKAEFEIIEYRSWWTTLDQLSTEESCCCSWKTAPDTLMKLGLISIFLMLRPVHRCHLRHGEPSVLPFWCSVVWTTQGWSQNLLRIGLLRAVLACKPSISNDRLWSDKKGRGHWDAVHLNAPIGRPAAKRRGRRRWHLVLWNKLGYRSQLVHFLHVVLWI